MNLFFYLQAFILNYSFIVILSDHIFCTLFYKNTTLCKTETCENGKKITGTIAIRFKQVLLYISMYIYIYIQTGPGVHPSSYTMGTGSFLGVKRPKRGVDHPPHLASSLLHLCAFKDCYRVTFIFTYITTISNFQARNPDFC
jgi:hypothetical protein